MSSETTKPTFLEVSSHFLHDSLDFQIRYKYCISSDGPVFYEPRSRRAKLFLDLRMGIECVLKSIICYFENNDRKGKNLLNWIEGFRHDIGKMLRKATSYIPEEIINKYEFNLKQLDSLPVGLRYRFDTWDFRDNQEQLYYETIGSDIWLNQIQEALSELIEFANKNLKKHSRLVSGSELSKEIMEPRYRRHT